MYLSVDTDSETRPGRVKETSHQLWTLWRLGRLYTGQLLHTGTSSLLCHDATTVTSEWKLLRTQCSPWSCGLWRPEKDPLPQSQGTVTPLTTGTCGTSAVKPSPQHLLSSLSISITPPPATLTALLLPSRSLWKMSESQAPQRTLARVVRVTTVEPIDGADLIELATVLGFQCVVAKKDRMVIGSLVIYFGLDALLEQNDDTAFLKGKRINIRKMRGVVSEGLIAPLTWVKPFGLDPDTLTEGQDLTIPMRIRQYLPKEELDSHQLAGGAIRAGWLGTLIPKTDEKRLQEYPSVLLNVSKRRTIVTVKMDGCSATYACKRAVESTESQLAPTPAVYRIHSRNIDVTELDGKSVEPYHQFSRSADLERRLTEYCRVNQVDLAIQGELCSPNINRGRTGTRRLEFAVFNVWDIGQQLYLPWTRAKEVSAALGLQVVPTVWEGEGLPDRIVETGVGLEGLEGALAATKRFLSWADSTFYSAGSAQLPAEGLVCKTDDDRGMRQSFKVIAPRYLLKLESQRT